jgi:hypothetical protein
MIEAGGGAFSYIGGDRHRVALGKRKYKQHERADLAESMHAGPANLRRPSHLTCLHSHLNYGRCLRVAIHVTLLSVGCTPNNRPRENALNSPSRARNSE